MGRVLGGREQKGRERKLKNLIKKYSSIFVNLRMETMERIEQFEREIKGIYYKFREILGPTAAGKKLYI
jgi:hypothetical protein